MIQFLEIYVTQKSKDIYALYIPCMISSLTQAQPFIIFTTFDTAIQISES